MSQFHLTIDTDNDAFWFHDPEGEYEESNPYAVATVLNRAVTKLMQGETEGTLLDANGNIVGEFTWR